MMAGGAPPQGAAKDGGHRWPGGCGRGTAGPSRDALEAVHQLRHGDLWRVLDQQYLAQEVVVIASEDVPPMLHHEDQMNAQTENAVSAVL
jgi:hypothetical protein